MKYTTNMITGECSCPDALFRDGGSYDLGVDLRFCKHFLNGLADRVPCPSCGGRIVFDPTKAAIPVFVCMAACHFSKDNWPIDARLVLRAWRELRKGKEEDDG